MRCFLTAVMLVVLNSSALADQPDNIRLDPNGISYIYPVLDTSGWLLTQPTAAKLYDGSDTSRLTHWADDYHAQDWARGCGITYGARLYAGISGKIVMAGWRGSYGNTVVIYDQELRFALKYSHLSEISVGVGDYVLAGKTYIGRVGNTGNAQSSGCSSDSGSHLHLALYKNVSDINSRPITVTSASFGAAATSFAAPFGYVTQEGLAKTANDPTVFVLKFGQKFPVSFTSFETNGWSFDKHQSVFRPLENRIWSQADLNSVQTSIYFWPPRDNSLLKSSNSPTVYVFDEGRKSALSYETFMCRSFRFGEILEIQPGERDRYPPIEDMVAVGCAASGLQSLRDLARFAQSTGFQDPRLSDYGYSGEWSPGWELRWVPFRHSSGRLTTIYRSNLQSNPQERYIAYTDPNTGNWSGWQRVY